MKLLNQVILEGEVKAIEENGKTVKIENDGVIFTVFTTDNLAGFISSKNPKQIRVVGHLKSDGIFGEHIEVRL